MTVYTVGKVISQTVHLDFGYIFQTEHFTVRQRFDYDVFKLFRLLQTRSEERRVGKECRL